jgi:hypothetical protein
LTGARGKLLAAAALPFSVLLYGYYRARGF